LDIIVVGGGFVGLLTAYRLRRRGYSVVVVGGHAPRLGASWGNAGLIHQGSTTAVPEIMGFWRVLRLALKPGSYISTSPGVVLREALPGGWIWRYARSLSRGGAARLGAVLTPLASEGRAGWIEILRAEGLEVDMLERGSIEVFFSEELLKLEAAPAAEMAGRVGFRVRVLSAIECRELEPLLSERVAGGIYYLDDVWINPAKALESVISVLQRMGVDVFWEAASSVKLEGEGVRVESTSRVWRGERAVIAAGAWTGRLVRRLGVKIPIIAGRGYLALLEPVDERLARPIFYSDEKIVISQTAAGNIRVNSYFELNSPEAPLDQSKIERMVKRGLGIVRLRSRPRVVDEWVGSRPCTPDGLPVIGAIDPRSRLIVAVGHCRLGVTLSPATARLVEELVEGVENPVLTHFSPWRFSAKSRR